MNEEQQKHIAQVTLEFFQAAFQVDGEVKFARGEFKPIGDFVVELNDSKRGKFYISKVEPV